MATENGILDISYEAAEDLSGDQFSFVVKDSGKIRRPDSGTEIPKGILQNTPEAGEAASVRIMGISKACLGGTVAENAVVTYEYNDATDAGKIIEAGTSLAMGFGICEEGGDEDDLGSVFLTGPFYDNVAS